MKNDYAPPEVGHVDFSWLLTMKQWLENLYRAAEWWTSIFEEACDCKLYQLKES